MAGRVEGKVAFITGAARGQGRSHAVRLAEEGADIIAVDLCAQVETVPYPMSTPEDLAETVKLVEETGHRIVAVQADIRDFITLEKVVSDAVAQLGRLDIVSANAGISSPARMDVMSEQTWQDMIDINLTGVWHTVKAAVPHIRAGGRGGSIVLTSSVAGLMAIENIGNYVAAKHGVVGLMRVLALELGYDSIRVNTVNTTSVDTPMIMNAANFALFMPDLDPQDRSREIMAQRHLNRTALPVAWVEPVDVSNAVVFLASDEARYITGVALPIDAGQILK
jgi:SDR family mycofactocin-dependent oxidoreductase